MAWALLSPRSAVQTAEMRRTTDHFSVGKITILDERSKYRWRSEIKNIVPSEAA
jgi:hypothetical protein